MGMNSRKANKGTREKKHKPAKKGNGNKHQNTQNKTARVSIETGILISWDHRTEHLRIRLVHAWD